MGEIMTKHYSQVHGLNEEERWLAHGRGFSGQCQTQHEHLSEVERLALLRCPDFLRDDVRMAALYHDFGKYSELFKRRLQGLESGLDHWSPGAHLLLQNKVSDLAGVAVHGHHVGLGSWAQVSTLRNYLCSLEGRKLTLDNRKDLNRAFQAMINDGFVSGETKSGKSLKGRVSRMLDARMVLSALVDADYTDTARHMCGVKRPDQIMLDAASAFECLRSYVFSLGTGASPDVQSVRCELWNASLKAAECSPGLFELEAPTGSGKTLAMLAFALQHIAKHHGSIGLHRIIVALPFLSILDQTVKEYHKALGPHSIGLLEHHSLAEWRWPVDEDSDMENQKEAEARSENWDAPIIITTTVQLFESLFTDHPGTSRKLCALSKAVILLDEAQTIPPRLISPTLRALSRLCHPDYGSTVVVATATQPLYSKFATEVESDQENVGWKPTPIAPRKLQFYERMCRYTVEWIRCKSCVSWQTIAEEIAGLDRALCIVNTRKDAKYLAELVKGLSSVPVVHLSTNMCAAHRRNVLEYELIKNRKEPCLFISTQCVEAGVDLDFPIVYRALAPLDAIAQAAGRCNRAGAGMGEVRVFLPQDASYPGEDYERGAQQTLSLLNLLGDIDPQNPSVFDRYFNEYYGSSNLPGTNKEIEQAIKEADFPRVAELYRLIERRNLLHIIVPYQGVPEISYHPTREFFRMVQPYIVEASRNDTKLSPWLGSPLNGTNNWFALSDKAAYDEVFGLCLTQEIPIC